MQPVTRTVSSSTELSFQKSPPTQCSELPESCILAIRALQETNEQLCGSLATRDSELSKANLQIQQYRACLVGSERELLQSEAYINQLLKQTVELRQMVVLLNTKCEQYQQVVDQLERDKQNVVNKVVRRVIQEKGTLGQNHHKTFQKSVYSTQDLILPTPKSSSSNGKPPKHPRFPDCAKTCLLTTKHDTASTDLTDNKQIGSACKMAAKVRIDMQKQLAKIQFQIEKIHQQMSTASRDRCIVLKRFLSQKYEEKCIVEEEREALRI